MSALTIEQLAAIAAQNQDQTETITQTEYTPPPAGVTVARFISYIELGKQAQKPYQGKPKPDVEEVRVTFELVHPKNIKEIDVEGGKKKIADQVSIRLPIKLGERARFKKLFNAMTYGRENIKHMAQMLGEAFVVTVIHSKSEDGKRTYVNLEDDTGWKIRAPIKEADPMDPESVPQRINVPAALSPMKIFLFDNPTKETWDSLFIDGTRTVKIDNVEKEVSKNWLQELILSAKNYDGSQLEAMLNKLQNLSVDPITPKEDTGAASAAVKALADGKPKETTAEEDLASLGL